MFRTYMLPVLVLLLLWPCASWAAGRVNCFIYHRFDEFRYPSTNISSEVFRAQLDYLREQGYPLLSHGEVVRRLLAQPMSKMFTKHCKPRPSGWGKN